MKQAARAFARIIDALNEAIGQLSAWLVVALVGLTLYDVAMRYLFRSGSVAAQELEWHLFGLIILLGAGFTLKHDEHVRVDLFYASARVSDRARAAINIAGNLLILLPFAALVIWSSVPFAYDAFARGEISPDPGGLHYRWILKAAIPAGFALLALQAIANTAHNVSRLTERQD